MKNNTDIMKKLISVITMFLLAPVLGIKGQIVTTTPSPVQEDADNVVVYFHSDQGNKGLMNQPASTAIYAHTGVTVVGTDGKTSDWQHVVAEWNTNVPKCKLEFVSANLWKLNIGNIRSFYGVPANEKITKLDFVFRSADGKKEGKTETGGDIFIDVVDKGFQIALTASQPEGIVNGATGAVTFTMTSTQPASLAITVNDTELKTASGATTLTASYTFPGEGDYIVTASASSGPGGEIKYRTLSYCYAKNSTPASTHTIPPMGARRNSDGSITFCIAAPKKTSAMVIGSWDGYKYSNSQVMNYIDATQDGSVFRYFTLTLPQEVVKKDMPLTYFYLIDDMVKVGDPYARLVLDPWNDKYISPEVFPNLPEYPADKLNGVPLAYFKDDMDAYKWQTNSFTPPSKTDLIIYEMLIRDFTGTEGKADGNGTVRGAIEKIPYLKSLGINAVELLPINEFNGNISWGYNPNFYFAVDKSYGTPQDYKEFIDKCHAEGIAVILDMVFNQSDGLHPWYMMYTPGQNPFYNLNAPHAYSVLNDWNQDYPLVEQQWKDVLQYWLREYKIDGFRFDLVKGLGNNNSYSNPGEAATNAFNQSRIDRMKRLHAYMSEVNPDAYFINENLAGAQEENSMAADGELNWANVNNAGCQFAMGYSSESNLNRMWAKDDSRILGSTVSYLESHDEQRLAYKQNQWGVAGVKGNATASCQRLGSAAAQMILVPGSHMIWQFSEMGNAQNTKNSDGGNNVDPKIVDWNLLQNPDHKALFESYQQLIALRLGNPELFRSAEGINFSMACNTSNWDKGRTILTTDGSKELYTVINPNVTGSISVTVPFRTPNNSAYTVMSKSQDSNPTFDAASGLVTVPANCYVCIGSTNVSAVKEIHNDQNHDFTYTSENGRINILNALSPIDIYNLQGIKVASVAEGNSTVTLPAGVYLLRSDTHTLKIMLHN